MSDNDGNDNTIYRVVVNHEAQYSIWPDYKAMPSGWRDTGKSGSRQDCLDHINEVWTDMRPSSLRQHNGSAFRQDLTDRHAHAR